MKRKGKKKPPEIVLRGGKEIGFDIKEPSAQYGKGKRQKASGR